MKQFQVQSQPSLDDWIWRNSKGKVSSKRARSYSSFCQSHDFKWLKCLELRRILKIHQRTKLSQSSPRTVNPTSDFHDVRTSQVIRTVPIPLSPESLIGLVTFQEEEEKKLRCQNRLQKHIHPMHASWLRILQKPGLIKHKHTYCFWRLKPWAICSSIHLFMSSTATVLFLPHPFFSWMQNQV